MRSRVIVSGLMVFLVGLSTRAADPPARQPWEGNRIGISDEVLPPWTPIVVAGDKVGVWGRSYRFGLLPMPVSVTARDAEVLAAPITLVGQADGKALVWSGGAPRVVVIS
jgi:hypothetical protein